MVYTRRLGNSRNLQKFPKSQFSLERVSSRRDGNLERVLPYRRNGNSKGLIYLVKPAIVLGVDNWFWASWWDNLFWMGAGNVTGQHILISYYDPQPLPITSIYLASYSCAINYTVLHSYWEQGTFWRSQLCS